MSSKGLGTKIKKGLNPIKAARDNKKNGMSLSDSFKESWRDSSDPLDIQGRQEKIDEKKADAKVEAAQAAELAAFQGRMAPNSPLNNFRPFINTIGQPQQDGGRLPQLAEGQQITPDMLRVMGQAPQYGQQADQQWQIMRQRSLGVEPSPQAPQSISPPMMSGGLTADQMAKIKMVKYRGGL